MIQKMIEKKEEMTRQSLPNIHVIENRMKKIMHEQFTRKDSLYILITKYIHTNVSWNYAQYYDTQY